MIYLAPDTLANGPFTLPELLRLTVVVQISFRDLQMSEGRDCPAPDASPSHALDFKQGPFSCC